jgi:Zn-dependent protease/predicted transcriptional regulator
VFGGGASFQLFRIFGFRVGVHWSWFLILFLWIIWLKDTLDTAIAPPGHGFLAAVISAALFFGSIVAHELGHALAARREGIGVGGVDLFFFGGFMRADRDSQTAGEEFRVAAAGPAVTLFLALAFGAAGIAMLGDGFGDAATLHFASGSMLEVLVAATAFANAAVFALNIVPAFPLDGGRILRAIVWRVSGDRHKATKFSAYLGQAFAALMMGYGLYRLLGDEFNRQSGIWWLVLGWMLGGAARAAIAQSTFVNRLQGVTAGDIMDAEPVTIPASITALSAYDDYFLRYHGWIWFPAVEEDGRFVGLAHRAAVEHAALSEGGSALVRELVADTDQVSTETTLETLVGSEPLRRLGAVMAVDADGRLCGVVTRDQVSRALQARLAPG